VGGSIYVGTAAGAITQTVPLAGYIKSLGYAVTSSQIFFDIGYGRAV
jgi:hypothetical protein